jgi:pimeloyl-ACP methyl ester carboxylesterase
VGVSDPTERVVSRDGTEIAYWTSGAGPPLVLVHGAPADHTRWRPLLPFLVPHATVHALDRRGRGGSGDAPDYALAREFEDVAAVVDAVAEASGSAVDLYGHSLGGFVAFGSAALTPNLRRLVLYEGWPLADPTALDFPSGVAERLEELLAAGHPDAVVETILRELAGISDDELAELKSHPAWQARVGAAHTVVREVRGVASSAPFNPKHVAKIAVPTLLVTGTESGDPAGANIQTLAAALPDARIAVLEGQGHVADVLEPEFFAERILAFLRGQT